MAVTIKITAAGAQPTPPATLLETLIANVTAAQPGYTANLPGSLIDDISGTDVGALVLIDHACVDLINSLTPNTANAYLLPLLGAQQGIQPGLLNNSSAYVLFSGLAGYVINQGFVVSDGLNQYTVQDGGVLGNAVACTFTGALGSHILTVTGISGSIMQGDTFTNNGGTGVTANSTIGTQISGPAGGNGTYNTNNSQTISAESMTGTTHGFASLYVVANNFGTWAIPANSITTIITSVPSAYPMACTNPNSGTIATAAESIDLYRARVNQAQLAPSTGTLALLKTLIQAIPGVQARLVSVSSGGKIMVGGGDPYAIANAIFKALFNFASLAGSSVLSNSWTGTASFITGNIMTLSAITGAAAPGDIVAGSGLTTPSIIVKQLTGTTGSTGNYLMNYANILTSRAVTGANSLRNQVISLVNYPDIYSILFVVPVSQTITMVVDWSTIAPNFTANLAIANAANAALVAYIESIPVSAPVNVFTMQQIFLDAVAPIVNPAYISNIAFTVSINGTPTSPSSGTGLIYGDAEGYFVAVGSGITITRI